MSGLSKPPGNPAAIENAAGQLRSLASQISTLADSTRSMSSRIAANADWSGSSADAYTGFTGSFAAGIARMEEPLQSIYSVAARYADALRNAQTKVDAYLSHAKQVSSISGPVSPQEQSQNDATLKILEQDAEAALTGFELLAQSTEEFFKNLGDTLKEVFASEGPFHDWLETITRPWDTIGGDGILEALVQKGENLEKAFENAAKANKAALQEAINNDFDRIVGTVAQDYDAGDATLSDLESAYQTFEKASQTLTDASSAFAPEEGTLVKMLPYLKNFGRFADVLGIIGGTYTVIDPPEYDEGAMRGVSRGAGVAMAAGSAAGLVGSFGVMDGVMLGSLTIPGIGEGVAAAAGAYMVGDWAYHHTHQIAHAFDAARHTVSHWADDVKSWF